MIGNEIGKYKIIREIARGGMGIIYEAFHGSLNRHVALKVLPNELAFDVDLIESFHFEAQIAANLNHPNIVHIYDNGNINGIHFIAMELVEGTDLKRIIDSYDESFLPLNLFFHYAEQIISALKYSHDQGIIHCDIKPQNMLITRDGTLKLSDFGIAQKIKNNSRNLQRGAAGTAKYISPEQIKQNNELDIRSDIYSFGVVLFEMATGRVPFDGTDSETIAHMHLKSRVPRPQSINPNLPNELEKIIMKSLEKNEKNRQQSMDEVLDSLILAQTKLDGKLLTNNKKNNTANSNENVCNSSQSDKKEHKKKKDSRNRIQPIIIISALLIFAFTYYHFLHQNIAKVNKVEKVTDTNPINSNDKNNMFSNNTIDHKEILPVDTIKHEIKSDTDIINITAHKQIEENNSADKNEELHRIIEPSQKYGSLILEVSDRNHPISDAQIFMDASEISIGKTDQKGKFKIDSLIAFKNYIFQVKKEGYQDSEPIKKYVETNKTAKVPFLNLTPNPEIKSNLKINFDQGFDIIFIDGRGTNRQRTPFETQLSIGWHNFGFFNIEENLILTKDLYIDIEFENNIYNLVFNNTTAQLLIIPMPEVPAGIWPQVRINGLPWGDPERSSTPFEGRFSQGKYIVSLIAPGTNIEFSPKDTLISIVNDDITLDFRTNSSPNN